MWQAEADKELTLSALPTTAVAQKALALAKRRYSTVGSSVSFELSSAPFYVIKPLLSEYGIHHRLYTV